MPSSLKDDISQLLKDAHNGIRTLRAEKDILRLLKGEPLDYVIGWIPFLGCHIDLSLRPLIPRQETEYWVEHAINDLQKRKGVIRVLDLFAGSGCIGIATLAHIPRAHVDFGELDPHLHSQILKNVRINGISKKRARVIRTNIFSGIKGRYDVILANPPYVARNRIRDVAPSVLRYEPRKALFGGRDGLRIIRRFLKDASAHLLSGGELWMEFDPHEKVAIARFLKEFGYASWEFYKDQFGKWRWVVVRV